MKTLRVVRADLKPCRHIGQPLGEAATNAVSIDLSRPVIASIRVVMNGTVFILVTVRGYARPGAGTAIPKRSATRRALLSRRSVIARTENRAPSSTAGGAVSGVPLLNGGSGAYCI